MCVKCIEILELIDRRCFYKELEASINGKSTNTEDENESQNNESETKIENEIGNGLSTNNKSVDENNDEKKLSGDSIAWIVIGVFVVGIVAFLCFN